MFVTLEGIEGCGKSTQLGLLAEWLRAQGRQVLTTREPGGSRLGVELRRILLSMDSQDMAPRAELFLYLADRAQHVATVIRPALEAGAVVLSDRYADSTVVYQGYGRGLDTRQLQGLNELAVDGAWPTVTILLDLDPAVGLARARRRNTAADAAGAPGADEGRFEAESLAFHQRIRRGFLDWAAQHPQRFAVVDAARAPQEVFADVREAVRGRMESH